MITNLSCVEISCDDCFTPFVYPEGVESEGGTHFQRVLDARELNDEFRIGWRLGVGGAALCASCSSQKSEKVFSLSISQSQISGELSVYLTHSCGWCAFISEENNDLASITALSLTHTKCEEN